MDHCFVSVSFYHMRRCIIIQIYTIQAVRAGKEKVARVTHRPQQPAQAVTAKVTKGQRRRLREAEREQE
jgi:hypothetical protein